MRYQESFGTYGTVFASSDLGTPDGYGEGRFSGWKATRRSQIEDEFRHDGSDSSCCKANEPDKESIPTKIYVAAQKRNAKTRSVTKVVPPNLSPWTLLLPAPLLPFRDFFFRYSYFGNSSFQRRDWAGFKSTNVEFLP